MRGFQSVIITLQIDNKKNEMNIEEEREGKTDECCEMWHQQREED